MKILIHFQIPALGVDRFNDYEERVLPILDRHNCRLVTRLRSLDGTEEWHVVECRLQSDLDSYRKDPERLALQPLFVASGASARAVEVEG